MGKVRGREGVSCKGSESEGRTRIVTNVLKKTPGIIFKFCEDGQKGRRKKKVIISYSADV